MDDIKRKLYKELRTIDSAEQMEVDSYPGKRPILYVSDYSFSPPTDVWETEKSVGVIMEIADLNVKDFSINYRSGYLIVEGERKQPQSDPENPIKKYYKKEIDYGKFLVKIKMNTRIDMDKIIANYKDGLLKIYLPKNVGRKTRQSFEISVNKK
jgi:HSP20 family molecular chaperone IbpA